MVEEIIISAPARLHLGMINPFNRHLRLYTSVGLAIDHPRTTVVVRRNRELSINGPRSFEIRERIYPLVKKYSLQEGAVEVMESIPKHVGLGSTTQLLLSVAKGLLIANEVEFDIEEVSSMLRVGEISGVGKYAFQYGGFIVDSGVKNKSFPKLYMRLDFPEEWGFIVVVPNGVGLTDDEEKRVFSQAFPVPVSLIHEASFHLFVEMIPSLKEKDHVGFAEGLEKFQLTVGKMFSEYQGGVFSTYSERAVHTLKKLGIRGVGQSSWGPAVYGFLPSIDEVDYIRQRILDQLNARVYVVRPDNKGAVVEYR
ncbi:MAG: GHMP kinase [Thermosphaera sp.]